MKIKITKKDVELALKKEKGEVIIYCCPIFQACKRMKLRPHSVFSRVIYAKGGKEFNIDKEGTRITLMGHREWKKAIGKTVTITPKNHEQAAKTV